MTNINMLKSLMAKRGYTSFTGDLMHILNISWTSASKKINNQLSFTQKEITTLANKLKMTGEEIKETFVDGADECESK